MVDIAAEFEQRVAELEAAIKKHKAQKQDDRCWLDDLELYAVLGESVPEDLSLPPKECFLHSCEKYWNFRQKPANKQWQKALPWTEIVDLFRDICCYFEKFPQDLEQKEAHASLFLRLKAMNSNLEI